VLASAQPTVWQSPKAEPLGNDTQLSGLSPRDLGSCLVSHLLTVTEDTSGYLGVCHALKILVVDDFGLTPLTGSEASDLLEVLEDRSERKSTIVTSQLPIDSWHEALGDPTVSDAVLDRLLCNAHILSMTGASMRTKKSKVTKDGSEAS